VPVTSYHPARPVHVLIGLLAAFSVAGCHRPPEHPNLLLVTLDTTRADRIGAYGNAAAKTPHLDRLAAEGVRCADAATAAPITLPSHSTIMTGLLPPAHGVRDNGSYALGSDARTLAERLRTAGYRTQAFVSAMVLDRRYGLAQGFEAYDDDLSAEDEARLFMIRKRIGPRTARRVAAWLDRWAEEKERKPFFVWTHLFDAHQPYLAPVAERLKAPSPYDAEITIEDAAVGQILEELRKLGQLDDTLVVVTADHGESLGEHEEPTHAIFIYDATIRVPLLLRLPGLLPRGKVYGGPVRTADLVPTILAALHLPGGEETQGTNLLPALRGEVAPPALDQYCESLVSEVGFGMAPLYGLRAQGFKWIRAPRPEIYDLARDPGEKANLYATEARRGAVLDRRLQEILDQSKRRALTPQKGPMDQETLQMLQALGYLAPRGEREAMAGLDPKDGIRLYNKLEEARHLAQHDKWAESEARLREILAALPANLTARNILALCRLKQVDFAGARREYARSLETDAKQFRVYGMLGAMALQEGNLDEAEKMYRKGLEISPGFVEAMNSLGMIASLRGDPASAKVWYEKANATDPNTPRPYRLLGDLFYEQRDWKRALHWYKLSLRSTRHDFVALVQAGNAARRAGERQEALHHLRRASRLRPDSWIPLYNLACFYAVGDEPAKALEKLEQARGKGFERLELLARDKDLDALRPLAAFQELVGRVRAHAPVAASDDEETKAILED